MYKSKTFLVFLFLLFLSFDCLAEQSEFSFAKLKYQPDWNMIPDITKAKENFFLENNLDYDDGFLEDNVSCWSIYNYTQRKRCLYIQRKELHYDNYGQPMECKRGDLFKSVIEDASKWLLNRDWSENVYKDWFYNLSVPNNLKTGIDNPLCQSFADGYEIMNGREGFGEYPKNLTPVKKLDWDYDVAQNLSDLKYGSKIIEIDFNNDSKKELLHKLTYYEDNNLYDADGYTNLEGTFIYSKNINSVKKLLKQAKPNIKDKYDYLNLIKNFDGKKIGSADTAYFNNKIGHWFLPDSNPNFFQYENQNYLLTDYIESSPNISYTNKIVLLINDKEVKKVCEFGEHFILYVGDVWEIKEGQNNPLCTNIFKNSCFENNIESDCLENVPIIKKYDWDYDINRTKKHTSRIINTDFNNDGKKELIYAGVSPAVYYEGHNIDKVKAYLKRTNLIFKNEEDIKRIIKKFHGKEFKHNGENVPDFNNSNFFEYNGKTYVYDIDQKKVFLIKKKRFFWDNENKIQEICSVETNTYKDDDYYKKDKNLNINIQLAQKLPPFHIHENAPLYDKSFVDEINLRLKNGFYISDDNKKAAKQYLYNKVKKLCGADLTVIESSEENTLLKTNDEKSSNNHEDVTENTKTQNINKETNKNIIDKPENNKENQTDLPIISTDREQLINSEDSKQEIENDFAGEDVSLRLEGVVLNPAVPQETLRCGIAEKGNSCVLYIENTQERELVAGDFYMLAAMLSNVQEFLIGVNNGEYAGATIKPGYFAQILIPSTK